MGRRNRKNSGAEGAEKDLAAKPAPEKDAPAPSSIEESPAPAPAPSYREHMASWESKSERAEREAAAPNELEQPNREEKLEEAAEAAKPAPASKKRDLKPKGRGKPPTRYAKFGG